jgi:hypothetical protein
MEGKNPNRALFYSVLSKYKIDQKLDVEKLIRAVDWALKFELNRNFVQHLSLITKTQMDRLLVLGDRYEDVKHWIPENGKLDLRSDKIKIKENREIDRDLKNGVFEFNAP